MDSLTRALKSLRVTEGNILEIAYNDNINVELQDITDLLNSVQEFTKGEPFKRLMIISPKATMVKEARKYLQEENHAMRKTIIAEAVIVHSLAHKMMFNIYSKFIKDIYPSRYFTDIEEARSWLMEQSN